MGGPSSAVLIRPSDNSFTVPNQDMTMASASPLSLSPASPTGPIAGGNSIEIIRRGPAAPMNPGGKLWKYMNTRAFATRYVLAGHFVEPCRDVLEIGGAVTPIDRFLTGDHGRVIVLDPRVVESESDSMGGRPCRVSHVRARFQEVDWCVPTGADYGLVMLGLELVGLGPGDEAALYNLVNRAKTTVIEYASSWWFSREQFEKIRANTQTRNVLHVKLDLSDNDFGELENSWLPRCEREFCVLEPASSPVARRTGVIR